MMIIGTYIALNETEYQFARWIARLRMINAHFIHATDQKQSDRDAFEIEIEGAAGEIAFARLANVYPDLTIDGHLEYDVIYHGRKIDVKATRNEALMPVRFTKKDHPAEFYACMVGQAPYFRFSGFVSASNLFRDEWKREGNRGPYFAFPQNFLSADIENVPSMPGT